jgi:hypothetical protein
LQPVVDTLPELLLSRQDPVAKFLSVPVSLRAADADVDVGAATTLEVIATAMIPAPRTPSARTGRLRDIILPPLPDR